MGLRILLGWRGLLRLADNTYTDQREGWVGMNRTRKNGNRPTNWKFVGAQQASQNFISML